MVINNIFIAVKLTETCQTLLKFEEIQNDNRKDKRKFIEKLTTNAEIGNTFEHFKLKNTTLLDRKMETHFGSKSLQ